MADVLASENAVRYAPDRDDAAPARELGEERRRGLDLRARRPPVRARLPRGMRVGRDHVPEKRLVAGAQLAEDAGTIVALASAGPLPVSWRSDVSGMPLTRVPR